MAQPSELQKEKILSQILSSPEFIDSRRYQELLKYLVDKSSKVDSLKEAELARELFGKDSTFDPSTDPLIRSYVSNLRKKLEHYYLTTQNLFEYKIEIPKGHYLVKYLPVNPKEEIKKTHRFPSLLYIGIIVALLLIIFFREFMNQNSQGSNEKSFAVNPLWTNFLKPDGPPTLIVIGDYLVLSEKNKISGRTFFRMPQINNEKDFNDSLKSNPKKYSNLEIADVSFVGASPALGIAQIIQIFSGSMNKVSVKLSHDLKWDDFDNHNIVFIGTFKNLYKLDTLFSRTNIRYYLNPLPNSLKVIGKQKEIIQSFDLSWLGGNYQKDYSVILRLFNSKNNSILFLTGFSEVGVMDAIKSSIDPNLMTRIKKIYSTPISNSFLNFEMISEVEGLRYTVFGSQIKYVQNY
jgi:hypothetical protein